MFKNSFKCQVGFPANFAKGCKNDAEFCRKICTISRKIAQNSFFTINFALICLPNRRQKNAKFVCFFYERNAKKYDIFDENK